MKDGCKHTKVGLIPSNWKIKTIQDMGFDISDGNYASKYPKSSDFVESGIPFIRANNLKDGRIIWDDMRYISEKKHAVLLKGHLKEQDILITTRGKIGQVALVGNEFVDCNINAQLVRINTKKKVETRFLFYIFSSYVCQRQFQRLKTGTALLQLPVNNLIKVIFPLPSFPEQKKIAAILSSVDNAIGKTDIIIKETKLLKKGLMQKIFTEGIGHSRFKETKIGMIPEEWEVKFLGELGEFYKGKSISKSDVRESGMPCIRYGDIYVKYEYDNVIKQFYAFIGKETAANSQRIFKGDIIFAGTGETVEDIGKCVAYTKDEEAYAGGDLVIFRPGEINELNSVYLSYCLNSGEVARRRSRLGQGFTIIHIYSKDLKSLFVPMPDISEQNRISQILSDIDAKIENEEVTNQQLKQLKKGLMQVLLTGKVRVKV